MREQVGAVAGDSGHEIGIGPQYAKDPPFTARMRFHQSWYRARVLGVPCGAGPRPTSASRYGSMLRREDGDRGLNFLSPQVFAAASRRMSDSRGTVEPFRLLCNMLSSQPLCFNAFAPLADDLGLATTVFRALLPSDAIERVTGVLVEYAPEPAPEYLGDRTAFDVFVTFAHPDGRSGFVGIEVKLTEPFSQRRYDGPAYRRLTESADSPWPPGSWEHVAEIQHNQLWRDHLLVQALLSHPRSSYATGRLMLLRHSGDDDCATAAAGYRRLLKPGDTSLLEVTLDQVAGTLARAAQDHGHQEWLSKLRLRYLDFGASESEWQRR